MGEEDLMKRKRKLSPDFEPSTEKKLKKSKKEKKEKKEKKSKKSKKEQKLKAKKQNDEGSVASENSSDFLTSKENIPQSYNYLSTVKIEHSVTKLIEMYKRIIELSPTLDIYQDLVQNMTNGELDVEILPSLSRYLLKLAAELKTIHCLQRPTILDEIESYENVFKPNQLNPILSNITSSDVKKLAKLNKKSKLSDTETTQTTADLNSVDHLKSKNHANRDWPPPLPQIKNPLIQARVFTHKSVIKDKDFLGEDVKLNTHNERLEFLGDAALYVTVTKMIYNRFPHFDDGQLSQLRVQLVKNEKLREFSDLYRLNDQLRSRISLNDDDTYIQGKKKIEADLFEAYIGGIVEDDPKNYMVTLENWLSKLMEPTIEKVTKANVKLENTTQTNFDAKRELYSLIGYAALGLSYPVSKPWTKEDQSVTVECRIGDGTVLGRGTGRNVKIAGAKAAEDALSKKELIEEYANRRAAIPRSQSAVKFDDHKSRSTTKTDNKTSKNHITLRSNGEFALS